MELREQGIRRREARNEQVRLDGLVDAHEFELDAPGVMSLGGVISALTLDDADHLAVVVKTSRTQPGDWSAVAEVVPSRGDVNGITSTSDVLDSLWIVDRWVQVSIEFRTALEAVYAGAGSPSADLLLEISG